MEKKKFRFSRTFLVIIGSMAFLLFAAYSWGFQSMVWWQYKGFSRSLPVLKLTPQDLRSAPLNSAKGMKLSHAGVEFEVPWTDYDGEKSRYFKKIVIYVFQSGRVVTVFGPNPSHDDLLSTAEESLGDKKGMLRALFGQQATSSNYTFMKTILEQTPNEVKPWTKQREAYRVSMLLLIKGIASVGGDTGLFRVEKQGWKGFQFDNPDKKPKRVALELYDSEDRHVEILFSPGKGEGANITV